MPCPALVALTIVASLGVGLVLSAVTVTYRDFRYVTPFLIQVWMYLSPVIYPVSIVPAEWQWLLALNPMVGIIDAFRAALLGRPWNLTALGDLRVFFVRHAGLWTLLFPPHREALRRCRLNTGRPSSQRV